ncbi:MAG: prepilin-type N-terminal cleavage/methylation domain-containing protein [Elusimicrobia bacterium]|nr:prepilin-type N-terminal cleavage/methylation domain-containing protein [Elusimicrobiota bacterium]
MRKNFKGFTLTELLMVVAIIGIIVGLGPHLLLSINRVFFLNRANIEVQRDTRNTMSLINRTLRQASANSIVIDQIAGQPPYSRITFQKIQGNTLRFYQDNNKLVMSNNGIDRTLATNLRYLAFAFAQSDNLSIVSVSITMERGTYEGLTKALNMEIEKVRVMND